MLAGVLCCAALVFGVGEVRSDSGFWDKLKRPLLSSDPIISVANQGTEAQASAQALPDAAKSLMATAAAGSVRSPDPGSLWLFAVAGGFVLLILARRREQF